MQTTPPPHRHEFRINPIATRHTARCALVIILFTVTIASLSSPLLGRAQGEQVFPALGAEQRVYDETGSSLTPEQIADLDARLEDLLAIDADVVVLVRALDATPEETLDQVEALQQAWVAETGANQDTAVAILINRNPDDASDARAGIFVGGTFDDGNVPRDEQEAIVDDALIPPLRDGDVHGSLTNGLDRLERSIVEGPPRNAFQRWADGAADGWLPWAGVGAAVAGAIPALALYRTRQATSRARPTPTTQRPDTLPPGLAGALVNGDAQASAVPATLLDLATRGALTFEPEREGGTWTSPTLRVRLLDGGEVRNDIEAAVWSGLEERAEGGLVSSDELKKLAQDSGPARDAITREMRANGWIDPEARRSRNGLLAIGFGALVLALAAFIVAAVAGTMVAMVGMAALVLLAIAAFVLYSRFPALTPIGQEAAMPWIAYRDGLKGAAKGDAALDLDAVLADAVAMNLTSDFDKRLKAANEAGEALRAFASPHGASQVAVFPWWIAFSSSTSSTSGTASTVSGGGSGGGGGAAGST